MSAEVKFRSVTSSDPALRVIFFHHAGGSAMSYLPLARALPPWCGSILFELAGRGIRDHERYSADFSAAHTDLLPALEEVVDRPTVLFGHSLGGLLAHNLAAALPVEHHSLLRAIVVSAAYSPAEASAAARHPEAPFLIRDKDELLDELRNRGGCPPAMLDDPEFVEHAVAVLGHDLHLADTYHQPEPAAVPQIDYYVWYGGADPTLTRSQAELWSSTTSTVPKVRGFRGGHFFPLENGSATAALVDLVTTFAAAEGHTTQQRKCREAGKARDVHRA